jgi:hypothetical protein
VTLSSMPEQDSPHQHPFQGGLHDRHLPGLLVCPYLYSSHAPIDYVSHVVECHTVPMAQEIGVEWAGLGMLLAWLHQYTLVKEKVRMPHSWRTSI